MIDCPQSLTADTKDLKLSPTTTVNIHTVDETQKLNSSKPEWDATIKHLVKNALHERGIIVQG